MEILLRMRMKITFEKDTVFCVFSKKIQFFGFSIWSLNKDSFISLSIYLSIWDESLWAYFSWNCWLNCSFRIKSAKNRTFCFQSNQLVKTKILLQSGHITNFVFSLSFILTFLWCDLIVHWFDYFFPMRLDFVLA